jgi:hypothetical protein
MMTEKRPRQYAKEILMMENKSERTNALKNVPDNLKGLVRLHVVNAFKVKKK